MKKKKSRLVRISQGTNPGVIRRRRRWKPPAPFFLNVYYDGPPDRDIEKEIKSVLKRRHDDGSGYSFIDGERDLSFGFEKRAEAVCFAKRVKKLKRVKHVTVEGRVWP